VQPCTWPVQRGAAGSLRKSAAGEDAAATPNRMRLLTMRSPGYLPRNSRPGCRQRIATGGQVFGSSSKVFSASEHAVPALAITTNAPAQILPVAGSLRFFLLFLLDFSCRLIIIKMSKQPLLCSGPAVQPACREFSGVFHFPCLSALRHPVGPKAPARSIHLIAPQGAARLPARRCRRVWLDWPMACRA
jgi:hypothetical protein